MALTIASQYNWTADQSTGGSVGTIVNGPIPHRRNGPVVSGNGSDGMSGRIYLAPSGNSQTATWSSTDSGIRIFDLFLRAKSIVSQSAGHTVYPFYLPNVYLFWAYDATYGAVRAKLLLQAEGVYYTFPVWTDQPLEWIELRLAANKTGANTYNLEFMVRNSSGSWTTIVSKTAFNNGTALNTLTTGADTGGGAANTQGLIGRIFASIATASAWGDRYDDLPDTTFPSNRTNWYFDPVGGSDSNDGSSASPWKTFTKMVDEDAKTFGSRFPANRFMDVNSEEIFSYSGLSQEEIANVLDSGLKIRASDNVIIAYNDGVENVAELSVTLSTPGLTLRGARKDQKPKIVHAQPITAGSWTLVAGKTNTYQATFATADRFAWQNRRALTPIFAANSGAAGTAVEAASPGCFWTDASGLMYVHAFNNINLTTAPNGTIETSLITGLGPTLISMSGDDQGVQGLDLGYTTLRKPNSAIDTVGGYPVGFGGAGLKSLTDCIIHDGGKHLVGDTGNRANSTFIVMNNILQGCAGWGGVSQTVFADYCSQTVGNDYTGNRSYYQNNKIFRNSMLMGTANYYHDINQSPYITHSNGGGTASPFSELMFVNEDYEFGGGAPDIQIEPTEIIFKNCKFSRMASRNNALFTDCTFRNVGPLGGTYTRCLSVFDPEETGPSAVYCRLDDGGITLIEKSVLVLDTINSVSWFVNTHGHELTIRDCTIFLKTGKYLISGATAADLITFTNIRWVTADGLDQCIFSDYDGVTITLSQLLGNDPGFDNLISTGDVYVPINETSISDELALIYATSGTGRRSFFAS